jgi:ABC-type nitrate/sulfonate/bicarbonate transport system permease component
VSSTGPSGRFFATEALPALSVAAVLGMWELAPRAGWVRPQSLPPFSDVAGEVVLVLGRDGFLAGLEASAGRWVLGLGLAILIGVPLGTLMGRSRALYALVDPLLVAAYPVPKAALILLFVLWWGAGDAARIAVIAIGSLIPIVISSYHGAHGVARGLLWSARALGSGRARSWRRVILPAALPQILTGIRIAISISLFTLLASELLVRGSGVGAYMFDALDTGRTLTVFAVATIVAAIGFLLDAVYVAAVRRALPWFEGEI